MIKTSRLQPYLKGDVRFSTSDLQFLADLAKVRIIAVEDANFHHYDLKHGAERRLDRLVEAGLLEKRIIRQPGKEQFSAYEFASNDIAKLFKSKKPLIGAKRNSLHEVITSRCYFVADRPQDFKLADELSRVEQEQFRQLGADKPMLPDASYTDGQGNVVAVEADSGQYNTAQVRAKQNAWQGMKQLWGQPSKATCKVPENQRITVVRF